MRQIKVNEIAWWENDGASPPTFTSRVISNTVDSVAALATADLDGDGDHTVARPLPSPRT